ncbi:hypothetical protein ACHM2L_03960 [Clostridium perfringens]|uniref:hypothetical protein n=1 Tax=Clostridium perfringens TaxID=1502 RepID=UPI002147410F|nr:hypothetical protein [Clostridium perfringens]UUR80128.1 hypothetical protein NQ196_09890 [Clostridium perfringens]
METKIIEGSIEDFNNVMTLFFGKETGAIRGYALGRQDLKTYYGDSLGDFNYGAIVVPKDNYVLNNLEKFIVKNDKLLLKPNPELSKYEVAK